MILPKKDIDNSSKPKVLSKESLKNVHNSENVRPVKVIQIDITNSVNKYLLL